MIDPKTREHVGQVVVNFVSGPIYESLDRRNTHLGDSSFPILITRSSDADSVVAPGFSALNESARAVSEFVLPHDHQCGKWTCVRNMEGFNEILSSMKRGEEGIANFTRTTSTGSTETAYIVYAPVVVNGFRQIDSSDFSGGIETREYNIYSLALVETEEGLLAPFKQIEDVTKKQIKNAFLLLSAIFVVSIMLVGYMSNVVARSVTESTLSLVDMIQSINR